MDAQAGHGDDHRDARAAPDRLARFFAFALAAARLLRSYHAGAPLHGALSRAAFVCADSAGTVPLALREPAACTPQLACLAPEQTGRTDGSADHRSDYYALGAVFYEYLTGQPPFAGDDARDLVHSHLARAPVCPAQRDPAIPVPVGALVLKLLSKQADARYPSLDALLADLARCADEWTRHGRIEAFEPGLADAARRLQLPARLYGREHELARLREVLAQLRHGRSALALVLGPSGVGKSALVHACRTQVAEQGGHFVCGTFDQFQRDTPYHALTAALRMLVHQFLARGAEEVAAARRRLRAAPGFERALALQTIPELAHLLGEGDAAPAAPLPGAAPRPDRVIVAILQALHDPRRPLVMFLDDLQWADIPSLQTLHHLMTAEQRPPLVLMCAMRGGGAPVDDVLAAALGEMRSHVAVETIRLAPLAPHALLQLVAATVGGDVGRCAALSEIVEHKTGGNPLRAAHFLNSLQQQGLMVHGASGWTWDLAQVKAAAGGEVEDLVGRTLARLAPATRACLLVAACVGTRFDAALVGAVVRRTPADVLAALQPALHEGWITPDRPDMPGAVTAPGLRFVHDRVRKALYGALTAATRRALHRRIGWKLLARAPAGDAAALFDLVHHVNSGRLRAPGGTARLTIARLNCAAAGAAANTRAFAIALRYIDTAQELLGADPWADDHALAWTIHTRKVLILHGQAKYELASTCADLLRRHARTPAHDAELDTLRFYLHFARNRFLDAISIGLSALRRYDPRLTDVRAADADRVRYWRGRARRALGGRTPAELLQLAPMTDPDTLATTDLLAALFTATTIAAPALTPLVIYALVWITATRGLNPSSSLAFSGYGYLLSLEGRDIARSYAFGALALQVPTAAASSTAVAVAYLVHVVIKPQCELLRDAVAPMHAISQAAVSAGDLLWSPAGLISHANAMAAAGVPLPVARACLRDALRLCQEKRLPTVAALGLTRLQLMAELSGEAGAAELVPSASELAALVAEQKRAGNLRGLFCLHLYPAMAHYLFGRHAQARAALRAAGSYAHAVHGTVMFKEYLYYDMLARLAGSGAGAPEDEACLASGRALLRRWARHGPMNHAHKLELVEAERDRRAGRAASAARRYDAAIAGARAHGYLNDAALASELAGRFYAQGGRQTIADAYLGQARALYLEWGALRKAGQLELEFPAAARRPGGAADGREPVDARSLDIETVIQASQTLAGEINLHRLLETLMRLLAGTAGAQYGLLLLQEGEAMRSRAEIRAGEVHVCERGDAAPELNEAVINYVRQTRTPVVLADARPDLRFNLSVYVRTRAPLSVLCLPLMKQGRLVGVLYLENNLATGMFTSERVRLLQLLSTQTAIALENAGFYAELEHEVQARTANLTRKNAELLDTLRELDAAREQLLVLVDQLTEQKTIADAANQAKSRFLAAASHDLRQPLHALNLYLEVLDGADLPEPLRPMFASARQCARHADDMFTSLLDISRADSCVIDPAPQAFPVAALLEDVRLAFAPLAAARGLELRVAPCAAHVFSDPALAGRILRNLVSNAIRYTERGRVLVGARRRAGSIELAVHDTGPGIAADQHQAIFDEFYRIRPADGRAAEGSGLGLAIVQRLAQLLDAPVALRSAPGRGSMFSVTLPRIDRNGGPAPTPAGPAARLDESVVVVVDGDLQVLEVVCRVLRDLGARALPARSAMEARRLLDECLLAPALAICAQQIEAETGQTVVTALRGRHGAALPALLLAHAAPEQLRALESATGLPVLPKPVNPVELRRVLAQLRLPRPAGRASVAPG